ncbi:phosphotransferase [Streptomyces sp. NPDC088727]|uniref:phosphotransferase n=1 Tax=Streptomyces sp. NPDC088727 TaxID=3365875 RepID=UPI0037F2FDBA
MKTGLDTLAALAPYLPNQCHMIHGDLLSRNVLAADGTITAVLDWGDALCGDHLGQGWRASPRVPWASSPCGGLGHHRGRRPRRDVSNEVPTFPARPVS